MSPQISLVPGPWRRHVVLLGALFFWAFFPDFVRAEVRAGDVFPEIKISSLTVLGGGELPKTAGNVVLVDFWASWCGPCKASFPAMARLHTDFGRRGFAIVAVSVDEKLTDAARFVKKLVPPFTAVYDREQKLVKEVVVPTMPTSFLIGRDGRVRYIHSGYHGAASDKVLRSEIEALLAEPI